MKFRDRFLTERRPAVAAYMLLIAAVSLMGLGCGNAEVAPSNAKATPANITSAAKSPEPEVKPTEARAVGKEIKPADGPALKSVIPPDGAVLGGVLNEIATKLPTPEFPSDAKDTGIVTVEVLVNEKGEVGAASAVSGPQPLRAAAVKAARDTKFDPPLKDGKPVKVAGILTFERKN